MAYTAQLIDADFKTKPFAHQRKEFERHGLDKARALLWQMRCGKTKVTIDSACALFKDGLIDAVLIFAPNGVHSNWIRRELHAHAWSTIEHAGFDWVSKVCSPANKRKKAYMEWWTSLAGALKDKSKLLWLAINSETMAKDAARALAYEFVTSRRVMIVFDESHNYRKAGSKRTKMARALAKKCPYRRILTGTAVTNSPLHAFTQYELLEPGALGCKTYAEFESTYAEFYSGRTHGGRQFPILKGYKNEDHLTAEMAKWSSVVLREECNDMPDLVVRQRRIEYTPQQIEAQRRLKNDILLEIEGKEVAINEAAPKLMKLQQIGNGFIIDQFGELTEIPGGNPRLDALADEVYLSPGKVIVWCQFRKDMDLVQERIEKEGFQVLQYHGRTSVEDKAKAREMFAPGAENDIKAVISHPMSGGQGLDLSAASSIIWYSPTFDAILRAQADERATAIGGKNVHVIDIVGPGIDEYILESVANKVSIAKQLAGSGLREVLERLIT